MTHQPLTSALSSGLTALALATLSCVAHAQSANAGSSVSGMAAAVQKAIDTNPEVTARLNALRAANNEVDVARGAYYPTLDLSADVGRDKDKISTRNPDSLSFTRSGVALTANQVLWDGRLTAKEVERLGHARTVRYFEFLAATEDTALEAARAYLDVLRFRKLVQLAEDNYTQHKYVFDQLQSKFKAGVGRGVDSEQANARLALAESNMTTEVANLHDVSARFLRLVGDVPAAKLPAAPNLENSIKADNAELIAQALAKNASISAAIENLRAVQAEASTKESPFQPRVEARLRTGAGKNFDGLRDRKSATSAEILLNWNLYKGGSDTARVKQFADLINQAADQRDKACRDVRQTAAIAQNDINRSRQQLSALDRNVLAIEKARDAYRQQFDIGQRSLLDLLNAENELYTAKRAYANADADLQLAHVRTQAARNTLVANLGLSRTNDDQAGLVKDWQAASDAAQRCPATSVDVPVTPREELDARARKQAGVSPVATPVAAPVAAAAAPIVADAAAVQTVSQRLDDWAASWRAKDVERYLSFYSKAFAPARSTHAKWAQERRRLVGKEGAIDLKLDGVKASPQGDAVQTAFTQIYTSANFKDQTAKLLTWRQEAKQWVIVKESNR
ncbi:adhesin transport system outer membrane protein [Aquabacterium commune]|uniref:Adhesin transport system outer membrane protein n=1 Tax=Aquabacterium commune TaxID=70586 RepID=A0A4R6RN20_9BURK|nr:TolC family outer membrane protein [Aquabacterium commune]TDP87984.1 adhesin transport system outer membrane protein [Aquabacterium commune]